MKIEVKVSPTRKAGQWEVVEDFSWEGVIVEKGQITDGASIPWIFRKLLPKYGPLFGPAILHDALYRNKRGTRVEADVVFLKAMAANGVETWKALLMYFGVRIFGGFCYGKENKM